MYDCRGADHWSCHFSGPASDVKNMHIHTHTHTIHSICPGCRDMNLYWQSYSGWILNTLESGIKPSQILGLDIFWFEYGCLVDIFFVQCLCMCVCVLCNAEIQRGSVRVGLVTLKKMLGITGDWRCWTPYIPLSVHPFSPLPLPLCFHPSFPSPSFFPSPTDLKASVTALCWPCQYFSQALACQISSLNVSIAHSEEILWGVNFVFFCRVMSV